MLYLKNSNLFHWLTDFYGLDLEDKNLMFFHKYKFAENGWN